MPGLRREEVALLTGVSVEYYARMERGDLAGVSRGVLDAVARALQFSEAEHGHLLDLARAAGPGAPRRPLESATRQVEPELQRFLDAVTGAPMWIRDRRMDVVATNGLGRALYAPVLNDPDSHGNTARFTFLNPGAPDFFPDWEDNADGIVATLRTYAGQTPDDQELGGLIEELLNRSEPFRVRWPRHDVRHHHEGSKRIRHPELGDLEFSYQAMQLPAHPDWLMFAFTADPGSVTERTLARLDTEQR